MQLNRITSKPIFKTDKQHLKVIIFYGVQVVYFEVKVELQNSTLDRYFGVCGLNM